MHVALATALRLRRKTEEWRSQLSRRLGHRRPVDGGAVGARGVARRSWPIRGSRSAVRARHLDRPPIAGSLGGARSSAHAVAGRPPLVVRDGATGRARVAAASRSAHPLCDRQVLRRYRGFRRGIPELSARQRIGQAIRPDSRSGPSHEAHRYDRSFARPSVDRADEARGGYLVARRVHRRYAALRHDSRRADAGLASSSVWRRRAEFLGRGVRIGDRPSGGRRGRARSRPTMQRSSGCARLISRFSPITAQVPAV